MKLNNKGFVISTLMYALLIVFLFLIIGLITLLSNRKMILDKLKKDVKDEVNGMAKYTYYPNGTIIYYNPVTNKLCTDYKEENSLNENKTGCMKWYIFNDNINKNKVNMILDHNTTDTVAYETSGTYKEYAQASIKSQVDTDTTGWTSGLNPRLITAQEVADITNTTTFNGSSSTWFYFDGTGTNKQTRVSSTQGASPYKWLFDYTNSCTSYGCNTADSSTYGYWTSSPIYSHLAWYVARFGSLDIYDVDDDGILGVRPVITIEKEVLSTPFTVAFDYTGNVQSFAVSVPGNYKIETWGASGGDTVGGLGGYTSGVINITQNNLLYIYIGGQGSNISRTGISYGGYNGGGYGGHYESYNNEYGGAGGGGSTDIRLNNGNWDNFNSLKSRIIVSAGGGGKYVNRSGSSGGGLIGIDGSYSNSYPTYYATGGTQTQGGVEVASNNSRGLFGKGANFSDVYGGSGGGGGYFGGGGSSRDHSDAGGGSSFISGHAGCVAITKDSTENNIKQINASDGKTCKDGTTDVSCSYHYSGLKFTDTVMIDGTGCKWTTEKTSDCSGMPTHDGKSTMTGNTGNGYAKITYLGK